VGKRLEWFVCFIKATAALSDFITGKKTHDLTAHFGTTEVIPGHKACKKNALFAFP
jgi:hypothetical protein